MRDQACCGGSAQTAAGEIPAAPERRAFLKTAGLGVGALGAAAVCVVGADSWGIEAVPNPDPNLAFPAHQELITRHGIHLHENLSLGGVAADRVYEFAYVFAPLPLKGATGSPGRPVAIV